MIIHDLANLAWRTVRALTSMDLDPDREMVTRAAIASILTFVDPAEYSAASVARAVRDAVEDLWALED